MTLAPGVPRPWLGWSRIGELVVLSTLRLDISQSFERKNVIKGKILQLALRWWKYFPKIKVPPRKSCSKCSKSSGNKIKKFFGKFKFYFEVDFNKITKLRRLGIRNRIVDNSYSKLSKLDCRLQYKSNSNDGFESQITILI